VIAMVLRWYSCLFALVLGFFMTGISLVLLISGSTNYRLDMLPFWKDSAALYGLMAIGVLGIVTAALTMLNKAKILLVVYTLALFALLVYGFFLSPVYRFQGEAEAKSILYIAAAALVAFLCSLVQLRKPQRA